jgi:hypothetical protein
LYRRLEIEGRLLHRNWALYDVEHVVFEPRQMSPERLQEGLEWAWRQSYSFGSLVQRIGGAPWSILPLWLSLNLGYRYYAAHLHEKTGTILRDPQMMAAAGSNSPAQNVNGSPVGATTTRTCGSAGQLVPVPLHLDPCPLVGQVNEIRGLDSSPIV